MAVTDEEIRELIEVGSDGALIWKRIEVKDAPRWMQREIDRMNKRAGTPVRLWWHASGGKMTRIYGCDVYEGRIRKALEQHRAGARAGNGEAR